MTETQAPSTELVPIDPAVRAEIVRALNAGDTVEAILARMAGPAPVQEKAPPATAPLVPLKANQIEALSRLPEVYGKVSPVGRRGLSDAERTALLHERDQIDALMDLEKRKVAIREYFATDLDLIAEQTGQARPETQFGPDGQVVHEEIPRDKRGHYLLPGSVSVPGTGRKVVRTMGGGGAVVNHDQLLLALEQKKITRKQYLAVTSGVRVFDADKARAAAVADPALLQLLLEHATVFKQPTATVQPQPDETQG